MVSVHRRFIHEAFEDLVCVSYAPLSLLKVFASVFIHFDILSVSPKGLNVGSVNVVVVPLK